MNNIDSQTPDLINKVKFVIRRKSKAVNCPESLLRQLRAYEELLSKSSGSEPYRHQIQLNAITEALVVLRGKNEIIQEDIDTIAGLSNWINYDFKEL